ncbi:3'(2'),5'-bisphosphate nucleotidase CysQ [Pseudomonas sp. OIL-1]|uniref:3'(2'),5'-bisphosphate nucleotidase CysQ n=1 Tax=Pseudomonas sp. OIL-1 TaxID=2706126 RepID=UPI0013A78950|nr:3'(2'),5'-bisphosphate nucleotidase CysQ [Pseudomonas sp. OIL-1]QIB49749.1 3'(2'),5'-bisphosphate nucleotidase CysQ [Pseudomonas sp. OIL-1]
MTLPTSVEELCALTRRAGDRTLEWWRHNPEVTDKPDDSPVTAADLAAHHMIVAGLHALTPDIPVLSEEDTDAPLAERMSWQRFWLVDPLDGTKEFIAGTDEFTVNIALIDNGQVVLGIVGAPARNTLYWGGKDLGAWRQLGNEPAEPIHCRPAATPLVVVASRRHSSPEQEAMLSRIQTLQQIEQVSVGSSLKFCLVAEGQADLYPRLAPTSQWDTAAAQAVVEGAGGQVIGLDGRRFAYPTRESWLNGHFVAMGDVPSELLTQVLG